MRCAQTAAHYSALKKNSGTSCNGRNPDDINAKGNKLAQKDEYQRVPKFIKTKSIMQACQRAGEESRRPASYGHRAAVLPSESEGDSGMDRKPLPPQIKGVEK